MTVLLIIGFIIFFICYLLVTMWIDKLDNVSSEYKQCHGCLCGWCDLVPGSEQCKKEQRYINDNK